MQLMQGTQLTEFAKTKKRVNVNEKSGGCRVPCAAKRAKKVNQFAAFLARWLKKETAAAAEAGIG